MDPTKDPMKAIGVIIIASFLIDSIINGLFSLLEFSPHWRKLVPDPESLEDQVARATASRNRKLAYSVIAGAFGIFLAWWFEGLRVLALAGIDVKKEFPMWDTILTGLILMAGADRMTEALKLLGAPGGEISKSKPIEVTGKLIIDNGAISVTRRESDVSTTRS